MISRLGIMQGRLSPIVNNCIQAFPIDHWREEFSLMQSLQLTLLEWTLDINAIYKNPIMSAAGQNEILELKAKYDIEIPSLTADFFMQAPFWLKSKNSSFDASDLFADVVTAMSKVNVKCIVVPLVDQSSIKNSSNYQAIIKFFHDLTSLLKDLDVKVAFESDFSPIQLKQFIKNFDNDTFGINYDSGNSASLGYNVREEFQIYGAHVINVHLKDRHFGGASVRPGFGACDFNSVFKCLIDAGYQGNFIMQTARSENGEHTNEVDTNIRYFEKLF